VFSSITSPASSAKSKSLWSPEPVVKLIHRGESEQLPRTEKGFFFTSVGGGGRVEMSREPRLLEVGEVGLWVWRQRQRGGRTFLFANDSPLARSGMDPLPSCPIFSSFPFLIPLRTAQA